MTFKVLPKTDLQIEAESYALQTMNVFSKLYSIPIQLAQGITFELKMAYLQGRVDECRAINKLQLKKLDAIHVTALLLKRDG
jgi:hypothetical protein